MTKPRFPAFRVTPPVYVGVATHKLAFSPIFFLLQVHIVAIKMEANPEFQLRHQNQHQGLLQGFVIVHQHDNLFV